MTKLYLVVVVATVVCLAYGHHNDEDKDIIPDASLDEVCFLPPVDGGCGGVLEKRYFFNKYSGECERFFFSCRGNANNFRTLQECQKKCSKNFPEPEFRCPRDGLFPNPRNCGTFFQCSNGRNFVMTCPAGLYFSRKSKRCEGRCDAHCDQSLACECKWPTCDEDSDEPPVEGTLEPFAEETSELPSEETFEPLSEETLVPEEEPVYSFFRCGSNKTYALPESCTSYISCSKGRPTVKACPTGLHYSNYSKKCEKPCKAYCDRTYACECHWPTCGTDVLCFLPKKEGPCGGAFERFFFDRRSGECTPFNFSGCLGNENNFATKEDCESKCKHALDICKLPKDPGPCKARIERFYYDFKDKKCKEFNFGGCEGNHNNFKTRKACEDSCAGRHETRDHSTIGCSQENDTWINNEDCSTYYQCVKGEGQLRDCPSGEHYSVALKRCTAPCSAYCDSKIACECGWPTCENMDEFTCKVNGVFKHPNSCSSYIHCFDGKKLDMPCPTGEHFNEETKFCEPPSKAQCKEQEVSSDNVCLLPAETGPCRGSFRRYYFNQNEGKCEEFIYGGCGGNGNNFKNIDECESSCSGNGGSSDNVCRLPAEEGPCRGSFQRYYFDPNDGKCTEFLYGGCQGNGNNFETIDECESTCLRNTEKDLEYIIHCTQNDTMPDMNNCSQYIQCYDNGKHGVIPCPEGEHYNYALKKCKQPCDAFCDPTIACDCGWPTCEEKSDLVCKEDRVYADYNNCDSYIQCSDGEKRVATCERGLHFNPATVQCDSPCDAHCDMSLAWDCGWPFAGQNVADAECAEDGYFPDKSNCSLFIQCINGHKTLNSCAPGRHFNKETRWCDTPCNAHCDPSLASECGWTMSSAEDIKCSGEKGNFSDQYDCSLYYECLENQPDVQKGRCEEGFLFDYVDETCVAEEKARCVYQCPKPDGVFPFPGDKRKYIHCSHNKPRVEKCPRNKIFIKEKCV